MTIKLITKNEYDKLLSIQKEHPILTFQNNGFEYIDKSKFPKNDKKAFDFVSQLLHGHVEGFREFNNFKIRKEGHIALRFQYDWTADSDEEELPFVGVGYLEIDELLNGFKKIQKKTI